MMYYPNWVGYVQAFSPEAISAPERFSHILYAFAAVSASGEVSLSDPWGDLDKTDNTKPSGPKGNINRLKSLKESNPELKLILSVGGYGKTEETRVNKNFSSLVNAPGGIDTFSKTAVGLASQYGFDGLDIDWEYPESEVEGKQFSDLLGAVRLRLDQAGSSERLLLCAAVSSDPAKIARLPLQEMARLDLVDYWLLMGYDYAGSFSKAAAHASNVYEGNNPLLTPFSTDKAIKEYVNNNIPCERIVLGMPLYGHDFLQTNGLGSGFSGSSTGSWGIPGGVWD
jgi:chitinase